MFGLFIALSSVIYVVEGIVPFPVPGGKWGFSNFLVLYLSYYCNLQDALLLAVSKSLLGSILSGTIFTPGFFMGFLGSVAAALVQSLVKKLKIFGITGVSLFGMIANNLVQFFIGSLLIGSSVIYGLLPLVLFLGAFSAIANAYLSVQTSHILTKVE
ncbi:MAG: Gx transporter family protein [Fervidobacterium sp.]